VSVKVTIVYNEPAPCNYDLIGEEKAELGVLDEVNAVHEALAELNYTITLVPLRPPLEQAREKLKTLNTDIVFNLFEGFDGCPETEAVIADSLRETGLPYTGCPGSALALALDKARVKALLKASGIATPCWQVVTPATLHTFNLTYPCIIKPCNEDSSDSVVQDSVSLEKQVVKISRLFGGKALVERFLDGREFNVTVMGNDELTVLPVAEITYSLPSGIPRILTFSSKWNPQTMEFECTQVACPAEIDASLRKTIAEIALSAFKLTGCRGYARLDFRLDIEGLPEVIEINPNPDISPGAGAARQAQAAGMTYSQFIEKILLLALEKT